MNQAENKRSLVWMRRALVAGFSLSLCLCLTIDPENLRVVLSSVCGADFVPEQREEDESEVVLIAQGTPQRSRRRTYQSLPHGQTPLTCHCHHLWTIGPARALASKRDELRLPLRC